MGELQLSFVGDNFHDKNLCFARMMLQLQTIPILTTNIPFKEERYRVRYKDAKERGGLDFLI